MSDQDRFEYEVMREQFEFEEVRPVCSRCGEPLDSEIGYETGICANCWILEDFANGDT